MLRSTRLKTTDFLLIIILAIALFFGAKQLALPMIAEGDAYSRALIGKKLIENHTFSNYQQPTFGCHYTFLLSIFLIG